MRISNLLASLFVMGFASQAFGLAEESVDPKATPAKDPNAFATLPEGKTLPQGVMRARYVHSKITGNGSSYDKDGNKVDAAIDLNATGGAAVIEYGISDKLSLQVQFDFVGSFETKLNSKRPWEAAGYQAAVASKTDLTALQTAFGSQVGGTIDSKAELETVLNLKAQNDFKTAGACTTLGGDCATVLASSLAQAVTARATIAATVSAVESGVVAAVKAKAEKKGGRGLGDTTVGVLYEAMKMDNLAIAVAGGLRYPTSNRDRAANEKPTGRGLMEIGGRFNIDYTPIPTLAFAWQNQSEVMAAPGKYNWAGQSVTVSREGVRNVGFLMIKPSLAGLSESLSFLAPKAGIAYDYDSQERMKVGSGTEAATGARASERKYLVGLGISTFDYGIPVHIDVEYRKSVEGQNISAATDSLTTQLKAYYRF